MAARTLSIHLALILIKFLQINPAMPVKMNILRNAEAGNVFYIGSSSI